jgi:integrase
MRYVLLLLLPFPVFAGRPLVADNAGLTEADACQVESWTQRADALHEWWVLPACNFFGNFEITAGATRFRMDGADWQSSYLLQGKTLFKNFASGSYGIALAFGNLLPNDLAAAGESAHRLYAYVPLSVSLGDDVLIVHLNLGWDWDRRSKAPPKVRLLPEMEKRQPYPLSWEEQRRLFRELPSHLAQMALFTVNSGCRDSEVCQLRWEWEVPVRALATSVFIIPGKFVKNGDKRVVVLNRIAHSVIEVRRGQQSSHVFSFEGKPVTRMLNTAWKKARHRAQLPHVRVHDLKHTFGRRLRAAGVRYEDRHDLLGHRSGRITTHYSAADLSRLIEAVNSVCERGDGKPELMVLRGLSV